MKALLLSPCPERLHDTLMESQTAYACTHLNLDVVRAILQHDRFDWLISFGYKHILPADILQQFPQRAINIHISYLPYNRGADPNFWSWFDSTPKGVTIHQITKGTDTGPILVQGMIAHLNAPGHTLRSSYDVLMRHAAAVFNATWADILAEKLTPIQQTNSGTYHRSADKDRWFKNLPGWDAKCEEVERLGHMHRLTLAA